MLQVRVDNKLKKDATIILDKLGIDMPTAIRLFLKKIVMEKGLPFDVKLSEAKKKSQKSYEIEYIPAKPAKIISYKEYLDLVCKVPAGRITRDQDICDYLARKYNAERVEINHDCNVANYREDIPLWRMVSTRGVISDTFFYMRETQKKKLEEEGLTICSCGANGRSLMVKDYRRLLFDFNTLE